MGDGLSAKPPLDDGERLEVFDRDHGTAPRFATGKPSESTAAVIDRREIHPNPECGRRTGSGGYKRHEESKAHKAMETLGRLSALHVDSPNERDKTKLVPWPKPHKR